MVSLLAEISWDRDTIMAIGVVAAIAGVPLASILGWYWFRLHQVRSDNALKRTMVERGMSASDIERVLAAGAAPPEQTPERTPPTVSSR